MNNPLQIFNNDTLGIKVRTLFNDDGSISVNAEDAAIGFGWSKSESKNGKNYTSVRWATINGYCEEFGFDNKLAKDDYIPESLFYMLGMKANNETAKKFQMWLAVDVIPSIRKTGSYNSKGITKKEVFELIKSLPEDGIKNEVSRMILERFLPVGKKQIISNGLNIKTLLDEFLKDETVIIKPTEYGLAVDKYKLYDFFKNYGLKRTEVLRQLDNANLIFHREDCRTIQVSYDGYPVRVVIVKE